MRSLPGLRDLTSGTIAVIGSGTAAVSWLRQLRSAGANVRWYSGSMDVAEEVVLASAPPGRLELCFADPLAADYSEFAAVVVAARGAFADRVVARARAHDVAINVVGRDDLSTFTFSAVADRRDRIEKLAA